MRTRLRLTHSSHLPHLRARASAIRLMFALELSRSGFAIAATGAFGNHPGTNCTATGNKLPRLRSSTIKASTIKASTIKASTARAAGAMIALTLVSIEVTAVTVATFRLSFVAIVVPGACAVASLARLPVVTGVVPVDWPPVALDIAVVVVATQAQVRAAIVVIVGVTMTVIGVAAVSIVMLMQMMGAPADAESRRHAPEES